MSTDDEERAVGETRGYERKIHNLMNEVGTLKNEVGNLEMSWKKCRKLSRILQFLKTMLL